LSEDYLPFPPPAFSFSDSAAAAASLSSFLPDELKQPRGFFPFPATSTFSPSRPWRWRKKHQSTARTFFSLSPLSPRKMNGECPLPPSPDVLFFQKSEIGSPPFFFFFFRHQLRISMALASLPRLFFFPPPNENSENHFSFFLFPLDPRIPPFDVFLSISVPIPGYAVGPRPRNDRPVFFFFLFFSSICTST